jgi:epoxide hydrolase 4
LALPDTMEATGLKESWVEANGIRLHCVEAGEGPLVVLLHGFPEYWYSWRRQIPALAEAGFRVVAPDMRGYNLSDKPEGWRSYDAENLTGDIAGLVAALGAERAHVVGHDWGAAVAWLTAMRRPEAVDRLAILNVPHPARMLEGFRSPKQLLKSWYMFFFQLPAVPEALVRARGFAFGRRQLERDLGDKLGAAELDGYVEAWSQPGAMTAMINYYRAALRQSPRRAQREVRPIEAPTLVIWGERDRYLGVELAEPPDRLVPDARVERIPEASHWVQQDAPERVNELLIDFLRAA